MVGDLRLPRRRLFGTHLRRGALCYDGGGPVVRCDPCLACGDRRRLNAFGLVKMGERQRSEVGRRESHGRRRVAEQTSLSLH